MPLIFLNLLGVYNSDSRTVRFLARNCGELVRFVVSREALCDPESDSDLDAAACVAAFDTHRDRIYEAARDAHAEGRQPNAAGYRVLRSSDFADGRFDVQGRSPANGFHRRRSALSH